MTALRQKRGKKNPVLLHNLLNRLFHQKKWDSKLGQHQLFLFWNELLGDEIAGRAQPSHIRSGVLWVKVVDQIWMQQLHLQKILLMKKINQRLKEWQIADIRFTMDSRVQRPTTSTNKAPSPEHTLPPPKAAEDFEELAETIKDDELRSSLKSLWQKMHSSP